jgi:hydrogenase assembly chaperone HypC/HupF
VSDFGSCRGDREFAARRTRNGGEAGTHCITCGDDGVPMTVVAVDEDRALALCAADDGSRSTVEIALVGSVRAGDRLLVHAGTAIAALQEAGA